MRKLDLFRRDHRHGSTAVLSKSYDVVVHGVVLFIGVSLILTVLMLGPLQRWSNLPAGSCGPPALCRVQRDCVVRQGIAMPARFGDWCELAFCSFVLLRMRVGTHGRNDSQQAG